jgi:rhomboid-related protein 1/2/3
MLILFLGNILLLIVIGIPMETIHGPFRIGTVYSVGVIVGGVMAIIVTPYSSLIGSSGGCYALMFAFVADIVMNFDIMTTFGKVLRIAPMGVFVVMDFGLFIRREFFAANKTSISWAAHLGGKILTLKCMDNK